MRVNLRLRFIGALAAIGILASCAGSFGPNSIAPTGFQYNEAIAHTKEEQILLNVVRLRYRDTIVFMDVGAVTSQQEFSAELSGSAVFPFKSAGDGAGEVGPGVGYVTAPTISYVPQKGSEFARRLLTPIGAETIVLLANSGWSIERLLTCCVERIGDLSNAPSASGPTPKILPDNSKFRSFSKLLRDLQRDERVYVEHVRDETADKVFVKLVIDAPEGPECNMLREVLQAQSCRSKYRLVERRADVDQTHLLAQTRTVLGVLYALSHNVDVPSVHEDVGLVTRSTAASSATEDWNSFINGKFKVLSSKDEPDNAFVSIYYRDHWFWIDDSDLETKTTFNLLDFLISLQSASVNGATPLLTLSAGR